MDGVGWEVSLSSKLQYMLIANVHHYFSTKKKILSKYLSK